jgi:cell division protein ZapA (FtsZ GTPase activity inhibitor)
MDVLGTSFSIAADEDPVYLENLLNRYRLTIESTRKMTGLMDPLKIAIVTGYLLCDEVQKLQEERNITGMIQEESDQAEQLTLDLIARIDKALDKQP